MKRLNIKLLVGLGVGFFVFAVGTHLLHRYQVDKNADSLLTRANEATDKAEEIRLLTRYLKYRRDDLDQLKRLLKLGKEHYIASIDYRKLGGVQRTLDRAVRENPKDVELQEQFLDLMYLMRRNQDATDALEALEGLGAIEPRHKLLWAQCLARENRFDDAIDKLSDLIGYDRKTESFDDAKATAPEELDAYMQLLGFIQPRLRPGDHHLPLKVLNQMVEQNKDKAAAYRNRAHYLRLTTADNPNALDEAEKDIEKALELDSEDATVLITAAEIKMQKRDLAESSRLLNIALQKHPDRLSVYNLLSRIERMNNDMPKALEKIELGLSQESLKLNPSLMFLRAELELDMREPEKARQTITRVRDRLAPPFTEYILARLKMSDGDYPAAEKMFNRLRPISQGLPHSLGYKVSAYLRQCYDRMGHTDKVQELASLDESAQSKITQAQSLLRLGKIREAGQIYQELYRKEDATDEVKGMVLIGMYNVAVANQNRRPEDQRDWSSVDKLVGAIRRHLTETVDNKQEAAAKVDHFMASALVAKGETEKAKQFVEAKLAQNRKNYTFWKLLVSLTNNNEQALKLLSNMEQIFGDNAEIRVLRARRYAAINGPDVESELVSTTENIDDHPPLHKQMVYMAVAELFGNMGNFTKAIENFQRVRKANPSNLKTIDSLFDIAIATSDEKLMDEMLESLQKARGQNSGEWRVASARKLLWQIQSGKENRVEVKRVRALLDQAESERRDWAKISEVRAEAFEVEGNTEEAVRTLQTAFEQDRTNYSYPRKIATLLQKVGRDQEAQHFLKLLPAHMRSRTDDYSRLLAMVKADPEAALKQIEPLLKENTKSLELWTLYSQANQRIGNVPKTIQALLQMKKLAPQSGGIWVGLVAFLHKNGKSQDVDRVLAEAETTIVDETVLAMTLGQANFVIDRLDAAKKWYRQAHRIDPQNVAAMQQIADLAKATGETDVQEQFFEKILALSETDRKTKSIQGWVRREKADALNETGTFQDFKKAVALVEQNADDFGKLGANDLRAWLNYHANRRERSLRDKAMRKLVSLSSSRQLAPDESFLLAQLHKNDGRWSDAKDIMLQLLARQSNNTAMVSKYVSWLIERNEVAEASTWLSKLDARSADAQRLRAVVMVQRGQSKQAAKEILATVPKNLRKEESYKLRNAAVIFNELGKQNGQFYKLAGQQWQRYIKMHPESSIQYVNFLLNVPTEKGLNAGIKRADQGVTAAVANKEWSKVFAYVKIAINALQRNKQQITKDSNQVKTVQSWLVKANSSPENEVDVLWNTASLAEISGNDAMLETSYRRLMKHADATKLHKAAAANNLAYFLATIGRGPDALKVIEDGIRIHGETSDLLDTRAMAFIASGKYRDAINDLKGIIQAGDETPQTFFHLALAEKKNGDADNAKRELNKALEQGLEASELSDREAEMLNTLLRELQITVQTAG